jgi:hypothetical protein
MNQLANKIREVVGRFETREAFTAAVEDLKAAGFESSALSVLDTHEALSAADTADNAWSGTVTGLVGEVTYIGPITAAGLIALAAGPVGAAIAAGLAAGMTGFALATPHTEAFAKALEQGALLLWVQVDSSEAEERARSILTKRGAADIHSHERPRRIEHDL